MGMRKRQGFIIIIVVALTALTMLIAWAIVNIGLGEILQSRVRNDFQSAFYIASAGAEYMYATLKASSVVTWAQTVSGTLTVGGTAIGTFSATANTVSSNEFCIVSTGTVSGRSETVIVKYGFSANFTGGVPLGSIGDMTLEGASQPAKLKIEGPAMSNGEIEQIGAVTIANGAMEHQHLQVPNFWTGATFDTNNDGSFAVDSDWDGVVTREEAIAQNMEPAFNQDNVVNDDRVSDKDAFYYYYTTYLNNAANNGLGQDLGIGQGGTYYYSSDQSFNVNSVPNSVPIIFVNGNAAINQNDQNWQGSDVLNHTIVVMGDLNITQPTNRPGDVLTIVAYGNIYMTGEMGNQGGTIGDIIMYTNGNFVAENGGKTNASILAKGTLTINTIGDDQGKDHRMLNASTIDWTDPNARPLGLPPGYAVISSSFIIDNESTYKSIWQRI